MTSLYEAVKSAHGLTEHEKRIHQQRGAGIYHEKDGKLFVRKEGAHEFEPVDVHPSSDAPLPDMLQRIDRLEALVKRIATHLGIEGGNE